mgnify:FL=1|tara:strand:+ start:6017 stop:6310 length:294 start_codon:yes stop_codon:yes gene_type:complete
MDYYRAFDFKYTTTIDIPEMGLLEQDVQLDITMDGCLEEYDIEEVCLYDMCPVINARNPVPLTDHKVINAIVERFMADPVAEGAMCEVADRELNGRY